MTTLIDPAADVLFDAVALDVTPAGVKETSPTTNEQWTALRTAALQLAEGANLLMVPGRLVEPPAGSGHQAEPPAPGDLAPAAIQRMITADRPAFNQWAERLRRAATDALASIEKRDAKALFASGEHLDDACEQCHKRYWYPDPPAAGPAR